jgi:hypothetical protein
MKINLHIERLILDGLPAGSHQCALIQSAVEKELARLLAGSGLASELMAGGALPRFPANSIQLTNDATPARLGQQIAGAVHSGIGGKALGWRSAQQDET